MLSLISGNEKGKSLKVAKQIVVEIRHNNGKLYTGNTLHILCGVQRYLREEKTVVLIFFQIVISILDCEMKVLQSQGVVTKKKQAEPIIHSEEEKLWETALLGHKNPQNLWTS